ncbi:hypothetical protein EDB84DRAFT_1673895 [Lactarius hengduanensis]|nr:hypothetical protein EDB84DRAFT_1673895 [Lactarius hengduanensis]
MRPMMQGIFAGAMGVVRGCVTVISDPRNERRAYAILGFCWGLDDLAGAIVCSAFESPAQSGPMSLENYPISLLATSIAATVTFAGVILSLFLGPDDGSRESAIRLPPENITDDTSNHSGGRIYPVQSSGYTSAQGELEGLRKASRTFSGVFASRVPDPLSSPPVPLPYRTDGYAYDIAGWVEEHSVSARRLGSNMSGASYRRGSQGNLRHRVRNLTALAGDGVPRSFATDSELSFAQRLVLANENVVTNVICGSLQQGMSTTRRIFPLVMAMQLPRGEYVLQAVLRPPRPFQSPQRRCPSLQYGTPGQPFDVTSSPRRFSNAIAAHPGVKTPLSVTEALTAPDPPQAQEGADAVPTVEGKQPSVMSQLPLATILQYGWLALHTTTHDMVFLTYVVLKYGSEWLNLTVGDFSQLTALMCLSQIAFQFYLYPN